LKVDVEERGDEWSQHVECSKGGRSAGHMTRFSWWRERV